MAQADQYQRFIFEHSQVRGAWVNLTDSYQRIGSQADYLPNVRNLLGELLAASVLMSSTLKFEGTLGIQAHGDGLLSTLLAETTHDRNIRGLARMHEDHSASDSSGSQLDELLGKGRMAITITPTQGRRYQGVVPLEQDTLAGCLTDYFARSEQLDTCLILHADQHQAGGLLLQRLPGGQDADLDLWNRVNHLAATVTAEELLTLDSQTLLHRLFHEEDVRLFDAEGVRFRCTCSKERTAAALKSIGQEECYQLLDEHKVIEMDCQFCHAQYRYERHDLDQLFHGHSLH